MPQLYNHDVFYTHYNFNGVDFPNPELDRELNNYIEGLPIGLGLHREDYYTRLHTILLSAATAGKAPDFAFLSQMNEYDSVSWVDNALLAYRKLHRKEPEQFPADGILPVLRRLRAYRKQKSKAAKEKKTQEVATV